MLSATRRDTSRGRLWKGQIKRCGKEHKNILDIERGTQTNRKTDFTYHSGVSLAKTNRGCSTQWVIYLSLNVNLNIHLTALFRPVTCLLLIVSFSTRLCDSPTIIFIWTSGKAWRGCSQCFTPTAHMGKRQGDRWRDRRSNMYHKTIDEIWHLIIDLIPPPLSSHLYEQSCIFLQHLLCIITTHRQCPATMCESWPLGHFLPLWTIFVPINES